MIQTNLSFNSQMEGSFFKWKQCSIHVTGAFREYPNLHLILFLNAYLRPKSQLQKEDPPYAPS